MCAPFIHCVRISTSSSFRLHTTRRLFIPFFERFVFFFTTFRSIVCIYLSEPPHLLFSLSLSLSWSLFRCIFVMIFFTFPFHYVCIFTLFWSRFASMPLTSHLKPQHISYMLVFFFARVLVFCFNEFISLTLP